MSLCEVDAGGEGTLAISQGWRIAGFEAQGTGWPYFYD